MSSGRPDDLDLDAWYEAAIRIDQNQAANAAFRSAHQPKATVFLQGSQQLLSLLNWPNPPTRFAHTQLTPGNPVLMDIDAAKRAGKHPPSCFRCGKLGHFVPDCPLPDIRSLERGEVEVLMEQLSARMDELNLLASAFLEDEPKIPEVVENPLSGFPTGSM